jgi:hypothetical protein
MFVPPEERLRRVRELRDAGASVVIETWCEIEALLGSATDVVEMGSTGDPRQSGSARTRRQWWFSQR